MRLLIAFTIVSVSVEVGYVMYLCLKKTVSDAHLLFLLDIDDVALVVLWGYL